MFSAKYFHQVQALLLTGFMTFIVSGTISFINLGLVNNIVEIWLHAWVLAYIIAFPTLLLVSPFVQKLAMKIASK